VNRVASQRLFLERHIFASAAGKASHKQNSRYKLNLNLTSVKEFTVNRHPRMADDS
jgi:hypothetical protein